MRTLLEVDNLHVHFTKSKHKLLKKEQQIVRAVDGVSFKVYQGETLGVVGESGSGKTTVGRAILNIVEGAAGRIIYQERSGEHIILTHGKNQNTNDIGTRNNPKRTDFNKLVQKRMSMIFQDPYSSLNPRMKVFDIIAEPLTAVRPKFSKVTIKKRVTAIAKRCKINEDYLHRFPHAFSGGQRQRICIARALVSEPDFVVCDESVSALDVSTQAEIVNLLKTLQREMGVAFLFIAHDLSVVANISDRVAVMYVGKIVELASAEDIFFKPKHPYTQSLVAAIPRVDFISDKPKIRLNGEIPDPSNLPPGCHFQTRCPTATERCRQVEPSWQQLEKNHFIACHHV